MSLGVNDEEILGWGAGRHSYLFPKWTSGSYDEYFAWLRNFPDLKIVRFVLGHDFGDGIAVVDWSGFSDLCDAATRAGVKLIPQLMHPGGPDKARYVLGSPGYANLVAFERDAMATRDKAAIACWDLFNEMDVPSATSPGSYPTAAQYGPWVRSLVRDVRSSTTKPLTVGHQGFGGGFGGYAFTQATFNLMNDVPGMDIAQVHWYGPDSNLANTLDNYLGLWIKAIGKPCMAGEFGSLGAYWPELAARWTYGDALAMVLDGKTGYPPAGPVAAPPPPPPPPPPGPDLTSILARLDLLEKHGHPFDAFGKTGPPTIV